jgi:hypothetical protein
LNIGAGTPSTQNGKPIQLERYAVAGVIFPTSLSTFITRAATILAAWMASMVHRELELYVQAGFTPGPT